MAIKKDATDGAAPNPDGTRPWSDSTFVYQVVARDLVSCDERLLGEGDQKGPTSLTITPDGNTVAVGTEAGGKLYDTRTGQATFLFTLAGRVDSIESSAPRREALIRRLEKSRVVEDPAFPGIGPCRCRPDSGLGSLHFPFGGCAYRHRESHRRPRRRTDHCQMQGRAGQGDFSLPLSRPR